MIICDPELSPLFFFVEKKYSNTGSCDFVILTNLGAILIFESYILHRSPVFSKFS